ncbi:DNA helicase [Tanacetum coccineum]
MRHLRSDLTTKKRQRSEAFAKCLLDVGNGEIGEPDEKDAHASSWITIPPGCLVTVDETGLSQLIDFIYDDMTLRTPTAKTLQEKAIICPKNETADIVNAKILPDIEGPSKTYLINDQAIPMGKETSETELLYLMEYLNTSTFSGFPPHELELKVGLMISNNVYIIASFILYYCSDNQYAISIKEDTAYLCLHSPKTTKETRSNTPYPEEGCHTPSVAKTWDATIPFIAQDTRSYTL